jgi:hypothetical protein
MTRLTVVVPTLARRATSATVGDRGTGAGT